MQESKFEKFNKSLRRNDDVWDEESLRFILKSASTMSAEEMAIELDVPKNRVVNVCTHRGISYFSENRSNWKRKGYMEGPNGYALYPYKGSYRESASVSNALLAGES